MVIRQRWCALLAAVAIAAGCTDRAAQPAAPEPPRAEAASPAMAAGWYGQLQWFGYVGGSDVRMVDGTDSYANWGWFATDAEPSSRAATTTINRLAQRGMKTVIDMGNLLWCGPGQKVLCPGWRTRLETWRQANYGALYSGNVLAISVRDEPFVLHTSIIQVDSASRLVKSLFPTANILLIEGADEAASDDPNSWFNLYRSQLTVADWIAVDKYAIHPATDPNFRKGLARMKAQWPGRRVAYAADGWWNHAVSAHQTAFGTADRSVMAAVMREWYDVAAADPDAIMLGVFIWDSFAEGTGSRDLPRAVTLEQMTIGRMITGRTRQQRYLPVGRFESLTPGGVASGWACDPDGAWAESVVVDFYVDGVFAGSTLADQPSEDALMSQCRSGIFHRFQKQLSRTGRNAVAVARDLNSGSTTLGLPATVTVEWVQPSGVTWGPPNTLTAAGLTTYGSGNVEMWWRDATVGGPWQRVSWAPPPSADGSWSNTIPTSNYCHDYQVYAVYSGVTSSVFTYRGLTSGHCSEQARVIWIQPQSTAGFGPAGSLVVAGSATGAPAGTGVVMFWRNATLGGAWVQEPYAPTPDANGIWYHAIPNANPAHRYDVFVRYDVKDSPYCTYAGTSSITWC
ncbi:MAG TPA: hypothetical protein VF006_06195 [Longimicrobium sp.]